MWCVSSPSIGTSSNPSLDDPTYDHIRFRVFDADDLAYRFRIIAYQTPTGAIRLIEFDLFE